MARLGPVILVLLCACSPTPGVTCTERREGGAFCVPDGGAAGIDLKLELIASCISACDTGSASCEVAFDGGTLALALVGMSCIDPLMACPALCTLKRHTCSAPPLPDGTYRVSSTGQPTQLMTVRAGGSPSCRAQ